MEEDPTAALGTLAVLTAESVIGSEEEGVNLEYNFGFYSPVVGGDSFEIIILGLANKRALVSFPASAWAKRPAQRLLPTGTLTRPLSLRVAAAVSTDRTQVDPNRLVDLWVGWLPENRWQNISFDSAEGAEAEHRFVECVEGEPCFPAAEALSNVVAEKFNFTGAKAVSPDESRLQALEAGMQSIEISLQQLLSVRQPEGEGGFQTATEGATPRQPPLPRSKTRAAAAPPGLEELEQYPGLDPATKKPKLTEVPNGTMPSPLELAEDLDEDDGFAEPVANAATSSTADPVVAQALAQLTKIVGKLSSKSDEVADYLADSSTASGSVDLTSYQSRRHAATLAALKKALVKEPKKIYSVIEQNMAEQFQLSSALPNTIGNVFTVRAWAEHRSRIQAYPRTVRFAWATAGALDCLRENRVEEARARLALVMAQLEQEALDHGSALLSQEFSLEPIPPMTSFSAHQLPDPAEMPYTRLMHPTWIEACAHRLKEMDSYLELRRKLGASKVKPANPNLPAGKGCRSRKLVGVSSPCRQAELSKDSRLLKSSQSLNYVLDDTAVHDELLVSSGIDEDRAGELMVHEHGGVPGQKASTIRVKPMWRSWCRRIFEASTAFGRFFRAQCSKAAGSKKLSPTVSVWPMPLPYHGKNLGVTDPLDEAEISLRSIINLQVAQLNFLKLGSPSQAPRFLCGERQLAEEQNGVIRRFRRLCWDWILQADIPAAEMGRTAAKQEQQEKILQDLLSFCSSSVNGLRKYAKLIHPVDVVASGKPCGKVIGQVAKADTTAAQQIIASRIKMEGAPCFDPLPFLDAETKKHYEDPGYDGIHPSEFSGPVPRVRVRATLTEKLALLQLLNKSNRLTFRGMDEVKAGFGNGLFCVPKDLKVDRLILDGRPANLLQKDCNRFIMTMGSSGSLLGIHLRPHEKLLLSGDDLSNFFYTFKVNYDRGTRNFLDWAIPTHLVRDMAGFPQHLRDHEFVYACLSTLAMGDAAACAFAQTSHISLGLQCGAFRDCELITMHGRTPRTDFMAGIIVDDLVMMQKVPRSDMTSPNMQERRTSMHNMYKRVQLEAHPTKGFAEVSKASFWGATVDGDEGLVRPNIARAASLAWVCSQVASLGVCTVGLLEVIAGGFVAIFSFRRRLMSLLDLIYVAQAGRDRRDVVQLSAEVIDELWALSILCPLSVADLRASSCWTKLLTPFKAEQRGKGLLEGSLELPEGEVPYSEHPIWECAARGLQHKVTWKLRTKRQRHINIGEVRAYLKAEDIAGQRQNDVRVGIGGDSQVAAGCICKGRSASRALNRELRKSLASSLGFGVYSSPGFIRSAHNPADDPTRGKSLRTPDIHMPAWWFAVDDGDHKQLDDFLASISMADNDLGKFPPLQELFLQDPKVIDEGCKSKLKRKHLKVRHRLRLRAQAKSSHSGEGATTDETSKFPWSDEITDILLSFSKDLFIFGDGYHWPPQQPGFLDLYSGRKGFAHAACRMGCPWVLCIDIKDGPTCNLLDSKLRLNLEKLLKQHVFIHVSAAPICASFSRAITPAIRSRAEPRGIFPVPPSMVEKVRQGNSHSIWLGKLIRICIQLHVHYWLENPDGSFLFLQPEWLHLPKNRSGDFFRVDFCTFKTPWRKRTRFLTSGSLKGLRRICNRQHKHVILRGKDKRTGLNMTHLSEPYPKGLCFLLAWYACYDTGCLRTGLCYRSEHRRVGEAKNPGPRARRCAPRDGGALEAVQLIRIETSALGERLYLAFRRWCAQNLNASSVSQAFLVPGLMGYLLAGYGRFLFSKGDALYTFRHLVVYVRREFSGFKGHLQPAWDIISRWEEIEPVEHRRPLPFGLMSAMVVLSISWGWLRVASVILIGFFGCCRPGEVLRADRCQLVHPNDLGVSSGPCYLRIQKPKPGRRGMGRTQHARISEQDVVLFLSSVFSSAKADDKIYPGTTSAFRLRWAKLLEALHVPRTAELTPAGLRAGGTVHLYRRGVPIMDILWALRLKNVETLQHYLQEIATQITMIDLPLEARQMVASLNELFPHFLK
eukprot:Skav218734  [mRNA]  locus=scaffold1346:878540:884943:+ [translate_table: standard]